MLRWIQDRLPTDSDADPFGMVLWNGQPGFLMHWKEVREHEHWAHSSAWQNSDNQSNEN